MKRKRFTNSVIGILGTTILIEFGFVISELNSSNWDLSIFKTQRTFEILFVGQNQSWNFILPGQDGLLNTSDDITIGANEDLKFPKNTNCRILMKSLDNLYCITIPELKISQFAIPDIKTILEFNSSGFEVLSLTSGAMCSIDAGSLERKVKFE